MATTNTQEPVYQTDALIAEGCEVLDLGLAGTE